MYALSQLIHRRKVLFPSLIQYLQHDLLFDQPHVDTGFPPTAFLRPILFLNLGEYSRSQAFFV